MRKLPLMATILLAACGGAAPEAETNRGSADLAAGTNVAEPAANGQASGDGTDLAAASNDDDRSGTGHNAHHAPGSGDSNMSKDTPADPAKDEFFDWTGRFAASASLCRGGSWNFQRDRISTAGENRCTVDETRDAGDKATLFLSCTAEGMKTKEQWTLTRRDNGMALRREIDGDVRNVNLVRCGG